MGSMCIPLYMINRIPGIGGAERPELTGFERITEAEAPIQLDLVGDHFEFARTFLSGYPDRFLRAGIKAEMFKQPGGEPLPVSEPSQVRKHFPHVPS